MLGETTAGSAWAYKALHPSDSVIGIKGVPDKSCLYSTFQNYIQQFSLNPAELLGVSPASDSSSTGGLATTMWSLDIIQSPHPLYPLRIRLWLDHEPDKFKDFMVINNQLGVSLNEIDNVDDVPHRLNSAFAAAFEKYRIAYQGVTINSTASDMFNQGTCTATQYTWPCCYDQSFRIDSLKDLISQQNSGTYRLTKFGESGTGGAQNPFSTDTTAYSINPQSMVMTMQCGSCTVRDYQKPYDELIQMPQAYTGVAKLGVYQPLKLTDFSWHKTDDLYYYISDPSYVSMNSPFKQSPSSSITEINRLTGADTLVTKTYAFQADPQLAGNITSLKSNPSIVTTLNPSSLSDGGTLTDAVLQRVIVPEEELEPGAYWQDVPLFLRNQINAAASYGKAPKNATFRYGPLSNIWKRSGAYGQQSITDDRVEHVERNKNFTNMNLFPIPAFCGDKFGQISFRGLSMQNPLLLTFRQGIQTVVTPGSILSMYITPPLTPDESALMAYAQIVNVLADAWPAYYNDWNRLKRKLQEAWHWFKPYGKQLLQAAVPVVSSWFI